MTTTDRSVQTLPGSTAIRSTMVAERLIDPVARLVRTLALIVACTIVASLAIVQPRAQGQTPVGTGFSFQGSLQTSGTAYSGTADLRFTLFNAASGGATIGTVQTKPGVAVLAGQFDTTLDFGAVFTGQAAWLQIEVRTPAFGGGGGGPAYTTLSPRQPISPTPYALYALNTANPSPFTASGNNFVLPNGNLGLGIDPPANKLSVNGAVQSLVGGFVFPDGSTQTAAADNGLRGVREFSTAGDVTFVVPANVTNLLVEVWGAGGGGGGGAAGFWTGNQATSCAGGAGGAGGNGGYVRTVLSVTPGQSLTMRVGSGGNFGNGSPSPSFNGVVGSAGGASAILSGATTLVTSPGGAGGGGGGFTPPAGPGLGAAGGAGGVVPSLPAVQLSRNGNIGGTGSNSIFAATTTPAGGVPTSVVNGTITPLGGQGGAGGVGGAIFTNSGGGAFTGANGVRGQTGYIIVHW